MVDILFLLLLLVIAGGTGLFLFCQQPILIILGFLMVMIAAASPFFLLDLHMMALIFLLSTGILASLLVVMAGFANLRSSSGRSPPNFFYFCVGVTLIGVFSLMFHAILSGKATVFQAIDYSLSRDFSPKIMGEVLFVTYMVPFFVFSLIYMAAIMAIVHVLGNKKRQEGANSYRDKLKRTPDTVVSKKIDN